MKLDNIVYDVDSLANAITEQWTTESPTFQAMYPSGTATSLVNGMAAYGSMLQYFLLSTVANCYTDTAFSESAIYQLANTLGNDLHGNISAQVTVNVTKNNFIGMDLTVPKNTQFEINGKKFFNPSAIRLPAGIPTVTEINLIQGEILEVNKYSSGIENEKFYFSSDFKVNNNYVTVYVNDEEWTVTDSFIPYDKGYIIDASDMNVVVLKTDSDGRSYIKVGNNQLGAMPASGSNIKIQYVSNDGAEGNIGENNTVGSLLSSLIYLNDSGNQEALDLTITSTTTAYGGFDKQSIDILRYSSPYIFASGHRAIRRQDYEALLQNKCGYITTKVWGEYEEADKVGAYDSLMMNMVYYTGIKDFQTYPYFTIGSVSDPKVFGGSLNSVRGFCGSFAYRIKNLKQGTSEILLQDSSAKGQLFINNDRLDPRDSMLPEWINSMYTKYSVNLTSIPIASAGSGYAVGDILILQGTNNEVKVEVSEIESSGAVNAIRLLNTNVTKDYTAAHSNPFTTVYGETKGNGTGLTVNIAITSTQSSTTVTTNDDRGEIPAPVQYNPILNARSDQSERSYYQSLYTPSLSQPVQIIIDFGNIEKAITGIKFKATDPANGPFIGTIAMFGTNIDDASLENIRNSENWDKLINRTYVTTPYGNDNDNWTDWFATNCFKQTTDLSSRPDYNRYKHYVIEFYSTEDTNDTTPLITFSKIKFLFEDDSSVIYYNDNGKTEINFPVAGSPGPGGSKEGYLTKDLINDRSEAVANFPLYGYDAVINGVTAANGYKDGNILAYQFKNENATLTFYVEVVNIDNGIFKITLNNSEALAGTEYINLSTPASLDDTVVYKASLSYLEGGQIPIAKRGTGYKVNDILAIDGTDNTLRLRVVTVDNAGSILSVVWMNNLSLNKNYSGSHTTTLLSSPLGSHGTGFEVEIECAITSGQGGTAGQNGTINITSSNNLQVDVSFTGNRMDTNAINRFDQPIIEKYNHFTTYLEFKQPEVEQVKIAAKVALVKNSTQTNGIVLQNVKNNIAALFDIKPDSIGKGLKLSDIYQAIMKTPNVEWCKVTMPIDNIDVNENDLLVLSSSDVTETTISFR